MLKVFITTKSENDPFPVCWHVTSTGWKKGKFYVLSLILSPFGWNKLSIILKCWYGAWPKNEKKFPHPCICMGLSSFWTRINKYLKQHPRCHLSDPLVQCSWLQSPFTFCIIFKWISYSLLLITWVHNNKLSCCYKLLPTRPGWTTKLNRPKSLPTFLPKIRWLCKLPLNIARICPGSLDYGAWPRIPYPKPIPNIPLSGRESTLTKLFSLLLQVFLELTKPLRRVCLLQPHLSW